MVNNKTTVTGNSSQAATEFPGLFYEDQNAEGPAVSIKQAGPSPTPSQFVYLFLFSFVDERIHSRTNIYVSIVLSALKILHSHFGRPFQIIVGLKCTG